MTTDSDLSYYWTQDRTKYNNLLTLYSSLSIKLLENSSLPTTKYTYRLVI